MKVAIIGAGGIAGVHSAVYESMEEVEVTSVVDVCVEKAQKLAQRHGAKAYGTMDEMLAADKPDFADVCVPTYLHEEMVVKAAINKLHVLCEKPMALDGGSAKRMAEAACRNGVRLMIAHVIRFWPEYMYLKKIKDDCTYGKLIHLNLSRLCQRPDWSWENWMHIPEKSGRAPLDLHIHDADFIWHLLGRPHAIKSCGMEDGEKISYISTQYIYDDVVAIAEGGWFNSQLPFDMTYRAVFENAIADYRNGRLALYPVKGESKVIDLNKEDGNISGINITSTDAYCNEIRHFINCIGNPGLPCIVPVKESLDCLEMVQKEVESSITGKTFII